MPQQRTHSIYRDGELISATPYTVPDEQIRRETAEAALRGTRQQIRADIAEAQADRDAASAATLNQLQAIVRRALARELAALRRERAALLLAGMDGDDGQD